VCVRESLIKIENGTMKQFLILVITFSMLWSCGKEKSKKTEPELMPEAELTLKKADTTIVYWQTDSDTIRKKLDIKIGNDKHELELKTYSLNDSTIISVNGNYKGIYHDYRSEILLTKDNDTILNRKLTKQVFKDSLNSEFYRLSVLTGIKYDGIRSNRLFFKGEFNVPDTDWVIANEFGIFYKTEHKNEINSWNYEDVGL